MRTSSQSLRKHLRGKSTITDTYDTAAEAAADRAQQQSLLTALNGWERALRRDECGAWRINGKHGTVHTRGDGKTWVLFVACEGGPGVLYRAEVIRDALDIRKRIDADELERRRAQGKWLAQGAGRAKFKFSGQ